MNFEFILHYVFLAVFILGLTIFLLKRKKNTSVEKVLGYFFYIILYRTKRGLQFIDNLAKKHYKFFNVMAKIGVVISFGGMIFVSFFLIYNFIMLFIQPPAQPAFALVLPFPGKGIVFVPPIFWVISIMVLAIFHEGMHGIIARKNKIKLHSAGFAVASFIVPLLPAAFVEPDDKDLERKKKSKQIEMFSAGPFANIVLFVVFLGLFLLFDSILLGNSNAYYDPLQNQILSVEGVKFVDYYMKNESPVFANDVPLNLSFVEINGKPIFEDGKDNLIEFLDDAKPGDLMSLTAVNGSEYIFPLAAQPGTNGERPLLGAQLTYSFAPFSYTGKFASIKLFSVKFLLGLFAWLYILNLGVGLFNLLPMGPLDGGRMIKAMYETMFKKGNAVRLWKITSYVFLFMLLVVFIYPFFL